MLLTVTMLFDLIGLNNFFEASQEGNAFVSKKVEVIRNSHNRNLRLRLVDVLEQDPTDFHYSNSNQRSFTIQAAFLDKLFILWSYAHDEVDVVQGCDLVQSGIASTNAPHQFYDDLFCLLVRYNLNLRWASAARLAVCAPRCEPTIIFLLPEGIGCNIVIFEGNAPH